MLSILTEIEFLIAKHITKIISGKNTFLVGEMLAPTPGGGHSALRYGLVSLAGIGIGLQDAVIFIYIVETLLHYGSSRVSAFLPFAIGGALSIITTPFINIFASRGVRNRQLFSYTLLFIATGANIELAYVLKLPDGNVLRGVTLAVINRVCVQSANFVPVLHDAAKVRGDDESLTSRRSVATSWFYVSYRIGYIASSAVLAALPGNKIEDLFLHLLSASIASLFFIAASALSAPDWDEEKRPKPMNVEEQKTESKLRDYLDKALFKSDHRLQAMYIETLFYGIASGLVSTVAASFFNDRIFQASPGFPKGYKWSAYSTLTGLAFSLVLDAVLPMVTFSGLNMTSFWVGGAIIGTGIFAYLRSVTFKITAMILFGATSVTKSTHNLFSFSVAAASVEPKFRGTSFSIRGAARSTGSSIGALAGGFIAQKFGFNEVMLLCAVATGLSGVAALFAGNVIEQEIDGAAVNANALIKYILGID